MLREATVAITHLGDATIVAAAALIAATVFAMRGRRRTACALLVIVAGSWLARGAVKLLVGRDRPAVDGLVDAAGSSFPSGHATLIAAVCFGVAWLSRKEGAARTRALVAASFATAVVASSRVAVGVHHPTDIAAGVALGVSFALITSRFFQAECDPSRASLQKGDEIPLDTGGDDGPLVASGDDAASVDQVDPGL